ncbi:MAG TPA: CocE/NonD family hydrolase [Anaerolineae bacterium]
MQPNGRYPTILIRTPYGRSNPLAQFIAQRLAERSYNVVYQDVRGRFDSDGEFEPYVHEAADGQATIHWIVQQSWSDGQVRVLCIFAQKCAIGTGSKVTYEPSTGKAIRYLA